MTLTYTGAKDQPVAVPTGAPASFASDLSDIATWVMGGRAFRRFTDVAALNAATGMTTQDLAIVDSTPGAVWKYTGATWVMDGVARFASVATRNSALASPVQGMLCKRDDVPYTEMYFGAYNAGTNIFGTSIGGTPTAGWFPVQGSNVFAAFTINNLGTLTNATEIALGANTAASPTWTEEFDAFGFHAANVTQIIPPIAGRYTGTMHGQFATNATGLRLYRLRRNGATGPHVGAGTAEALAPSGTGNGYAVATVQDVLMNGTTDYFEGVAYQASGGTLAVTARLVLRYDGPPVGP
jgi:hypothetical protein